MATDIPHLGQFRCPCLCHWYDEHVSASMADGMDDVEAVYGNLSGRSGMPGVDNTGANLVGEEVLC